MRIGAAACLALLLGAIPRPSFGEVPADTPDLGRLLDCRGLRDGAGRLACFDREAQALSARLDARELVVVDKARIRETQRRRFGLSSAGMEAFAGKDGQRLSAVQSNVASAVADPYGKWIVTLADGSRWHQIDDFPLAHAPASGQQVTIGRAAVGSFRMTIAGQALRVRRER